MDNEHAEFPPYALPYHNLAQHPSSSAGTQLSGAPNTSTSLPQQQNFQQNTFNRGFSMAGQPHRGRGGSKNRRHSFRQSQGSHDGQNRNRAYSGADNQGFNSTNMYVPNSTPREVEHVLHGYHGTHSQAGPPPIQTGFGQYNPDMNGPMSAPVLTMISPRGQSSPASTSASTSRLPSSQPMDQHHMRAFSTPQPASLLQNEGTHPHRRGPRAPTHSDGPSSHRSYNGRVPVIINSYPAHLRGSLQQLVAHCNLQLHDTNVKRLEKLEGLGKSFKDCSALERKYDGEAIAAFDQGIAHFERAIGSTSPEKKLHHERESAAAMRRAMKLQEDARKWRAETERLRDALEEVKDSDYKDLLKSVDSIMTYFQQALDGTLVWPPTAAAEVESKVSPAKTGIHDPKEGPTKEEVEGVSEVTQRLAVIERQRALEPDDSSSDTDNAGSEPAEGVKRKGKQAEEGSKDKKPTSEDELPNFQSSTKKYGIKAQAATRSASAPVGSAPEDADPKPSGKEPLAKPENAGGQKQEMEGKKATSEAKKKRQHKGKRRASATSSKASTSGSI